MTDSLRIGIFHNRYRYRGGEDAVVEVETELLRKAGHRVHLFSVDNREELRGVAGRLRVALSVRRNRSIAGRALGFAHDRELDVAHVHNFFPVLSPGVHEALHDAGIPVVQTLHNYRLLCANGLFLREGRVCEDCVVAGPWNAVRHGCYRGSRAQTALWADMVVHHRRSRTWHEAVDLFTTPSEFARRKLVAGGLPEERIRVKPNPVIDPGAATPAGHGAVYVGRLSPEKGVALLLDAWRTQRGRSLTIVGTGPEEAALRAQAAMVPGVRFLGALAPDRVGEVLREAAFLVAPSLCYENFPMAVAEAMAHGRAVVAPRGTAVGELVDDLRTGLLFELGDGRGLAAACATLLADPSRTAEMGHEARLRYEDTLSPERSVERLEAVYSEVLWP